jgi:hypothetical protein
VCPAVARVCPAVASAVVAIRVHVHSGSPAPGSV